MTAYPVQRDTTCPKAGQFALYRFFDAREQLLYVGYSNEPWRRRKQHSVTQPWYPQVRHQSITWYDSEREARRAENAAIRQERPHFNIAGAIRPPRARFRLHMPTITAVTALWMYSGPALAVLTRFPALRPVLAPCALVLWVTSLPMSVTACVIASGPFIQRFGAWLERNTIHSARKAQS